MSAYDLARDGRWEKVRNMIDRWTSIAVIVERGYPDTADEYLNDLDSRRLIDDYLASMPNEFVEAMPDVLTTKLEDADQRFRRSTVESRECVWGVENEAEYGWSRDREWYYYRLPRVLPDPW
ncbi:MAG: hypothetical protein ACO1Q7_21040 [Gemmatimonas sp.]